MTFILSTEDVAGHSFKHGYHLGTDEQVARRIAEAKFHGRVKFGMPVVTVALMRDGKVFDVYHGDRWQSEAAEAEGVGGAI